VHIDICIENELAPVNSQLIRAYGVFDPRVRPLVLAVKHFARQRNINEPYRGTLSSYGYVLLVIHFLQQRRPPVLPCLQELNRNQRPAQPRIAGFDVSYCDSNELAHQLFPTNNSASLSELLAEFFRYYAHEFDYHDSVISVRTGGLLSKSEKGWTSGGPRETDENADDAAADKAEQPRKGPPERTLFCIEDPFEVSHNLGRIVGRNQLHTIRGEFMRAWRIIVDGFEPVANIFQRI
jgi:DNA polymerase sigma